MSDPRQNVRPGDKLRLAAAQVNWINAAMRPNMGYQAGELPGVPPVTNIVYVRNNTGYDLPRWWPLSISGMDVDPDDDGPLDSVEPIGPALRQFQEQAVLVSDLSGPGVPRAQYVVTVDPIKAGEIGRAAISGVVPAQVLVNDDGRTDPALHKFVRVRNATFTSGPPWQTAVAGDAAILWIGSPIDNVANALVRIGFRNHQAIRLGKYDPEGGSAWNPGTSAVVTMWDGGMDSSATPTAAVEVSPAESVTAFNYSRKIKAGSWVVIGLCQDDVYYVLEAGWPSEDDCRTIAGQDMADIPGWDDTKIQLLGHDTSGCLNWYDTTDCSGA